MTEPTVDRRQSTDRTNSRRTGIDSRKRSHTPLNRVPLRHTPCSHTPHRRTPQSQTPHTLQSHTHTHFIDYANRYIRLPLIWCGWGSILTEIKVGDEEQKSQLEAIDEELSYPIQPPKSATATEMVQTKARATVGACASTVQSMCRAQHTGCPIRLIVFEFELTLHALSHSLCKLCCTHFCLSR